MDAPALPPWLPQRPLRILSVSTMFPSEALPVHAVFVRHRLLALARLADVRVLSPVPDFPLVARFVEKYAPRLRIPTEQVHARGGAHLHATYPRFFSVPAVAKPVEGFSLARRLGLELDRLERSAGWVPDVLDAHLAFPDGFAAVLVAARRGLPVTVTLRGHDINDLDRFPIRWRQVKYALGHATRVFGVCRALIDGAIAAGAPPERTAVLANGVDPGLFHPLPKAEARRATGLPLDRRVILSVGHMVERKGFRLLVDALARLHRDGQTDLMLVLAGAGGEEGDDTPNIKARAAAAGVAEHVRFVGAVPNDQLHRWYAAADVFALASEKEGWPNVLFEALACGTPPVATRVWGTPECLHRPDFGVLVDERSGEGLAAGLREALQRAWDADLLVRYARANTWADVGRRFHTELVRAIGHHRGHTLDALAADLGPVPVGPNAPQEPVR
jgi:teichuronic acid biosynthesis glycosyltransferase TuaC